MLAIIALALLGYFLGSVPWGLVVAKTFCKIDPREGGSKNTGATNVARLCGFKWGVATLFCDIVKGALPVALALKFCPSAVAVSIIAICAVAGHVFSCFMGFRGGKAVATSIGVLAPIAFFPTLISSLICIAVILWKDYVSLGSLVLLGSLPVTLSCFGMFEWLPLSLVLFALVAWRHRENIARLRAGTEKSWRKSRQNNG